MIISTVTPDAAVAVASQVRREAARLDASLIYVDANSVSPQTIGRIADEFQDSNIQFVDAAIHGLASRLKTQGTIFAMAPPLASSASSSVPTFESEFWGASPEMHHS